MTRRAKRFLAGAGVALVVLYLAGPWILGRIGAFLVVDADAVDQADAVVVLSTGVDYLPRLMQAAALYRQGLARLVVINGNRKTAADRRLEQQGFVPPHPWYDLAVAMLVFLGVDQHRIVAVSAEDAYDTVSEAAMVGHALKDLHGDLRKLIITTSKFHTRRAIAIWRYLYSRDFQLQVVAAADDPFTPDGWWHHGRQIRQVLAEYGGWLYFWGKRLQGQDGP